MDAVAEYDPSAWFSDYQIQDQIFGITRVVSAEGADAVGECYTASYSVYSYGLMRSEEFKTRNAFALALIQNLMSNIFALNTLYHNIETALVDQKPDDVAFYIGRLIYTIIYFDPITEAAAATTANARASSSFEETLFSLEEVSQPAPLGGNITAQEV